MDAKRKNRHIIDEELFEMGARERRLLNKILNTNDDAARDTEAPPLHKKKTSDTPQLSRGTEREKVRVLMITSDTSIFTDKSHTQQQYLTYGALFDELHVVVMTQREHGQSNIVQLAENIWIYPTHSTSRVRALYDAYQLAQAQVAFVSGLRVDIISCSTPFEEGLVGYALARKYKRPLQLQVHVDFLDSRFQTMNEANKWRLWLSWFLLPRADSIFVTSSRLQQKLQQRYKDIAHFIVMMPPYRDLEAWRETRPDFDLKQRHPQFRFIALVIAASGDDYDVHIAIDSCARALNLYTTFGLVIVGQIQDPQAVMSHLEAGGFRDKVILERPVESLVSHMKTADVLLNIGSREEDEVNLVLAAAAGLPVITARGGIADQIFEDGVSGYVCPQDDVGCFSSRVRDFLNNNALRATFEINARDRVFSVINQDKEVHLDSFTRIFEDCIVRYEHKRNI